MCNVYRVLLVLIVILTFSATGVCQTWNWAGQVAAFSTGGDPVNRVTGISIDQNENIYVLGDFGDSVTIGGTKLKSNSIGDDMFVAKLNSSGTFTWAKSFGSQYYIDRAIDIATDPYGGVYVCAQFDGTLNFGTIQLNAVSISSVALAKYNSNGDVLWAKLVWNIHSGPGGLAYDDNHIYLAVNRTLVKYDLDGDSVWTRFMPNNVSTPFEYNDVTVDTWGNVYATGSFTGFAYFDNDTLRSASVSDVDVFVVKYDKDGNYLWSKKAGAVTNPSQEDVGRAIATSPVGEVYVVGKYNGKAFFEIDSLMSGTASYGMFIANYSGDGDLRWVRGGSGVGALSTSDAYGVRVLPDDDILVAGDYKFKVNITDTTFSLTGATEVLMLRLGPDGTRRWGKRSDSQISGCTAYSLALNADGTGAYVGGQFVTSTKFGPTTMTCVGPLSDGFIAKMTINTATDVHEITGSPLPQSFALSQNYPNPFNPTTTIDMKIAQTENVALEVVNILGEHVRTLVNQELRAGNYSVAWDGRDDNNQLLSSGVYFYRLHSGSYVETHKMTLLK